MTVIRGLIDRVILVCGIIAGGTIPSFIAQYRQRIGGALDQVQKDLAPFQQIANAQFGGDLHALIQHHLNSSDAAFHSEGQAINDMVQSADALRQTANALNSDLFHQLSYLSAHAQPAFLKATWNSFVPAFSLSAEGLMVAATVGAAIWLAFLGTWFTGGWTLKTSYRALHQHKA